MMMLLTQCFHRIDSGLNRLRKPIGQVGFLLRSMQLNSIDGALHDRPLNIDIPRPQRVLLNEFAPRLDLVAHQHGEHPVGFDRVIDLHPEQAADFRIHGGFPQLRRVHLAQAFVALACSGVFSLADQPAHRLAKVANPFFLAPLAFAAHDFGAVADQVFERRGGFGQGGQCEIGARDSLYKFDAKISANAKRGYNFRD